MYPTVQEARSLHTFGRETPVDGDRLAVWWLHTRRMQDMVKRCPCTAGDAVVRWTA